MKVIDSNTAKEELKRINTVLQGPHLLIGGLAIQQYHSARNSKDIDLICDNKTVKELISKLYPSKDYEVSEINNDEYRPSFEITHRLNKGKVIFFGPKVIEREPYPFLSWESLLEGSIPFSFQKEKLENVRVPQIEILAFTKLLSFFNRVEVNLAKGEQDLIDFINLSNNASFRINILIDLIRSSNIQGYISKKLQHLTSYNTELWKSSLFLDFMKILMPLLDGESRSDNLFEDNYIRIFKVTETTEFYNKIAHEYDERNTKQIFDTHKEIIELISDENTEKPILKVLDLGSGTGRLIAFQFIRNSNIHWTCVDSSIKMIKQFERNMLNSKIQLEQFENSIFELPQEVKLKKYDIILFSYVLTSLPQNPDFKEIVSMLNDDGKLIMAEHDPSYTQRKPLYDFNLGGEKIALSLRKVYPLEIISELLEQGLMLEYVHNIENEKRQKYSYVMKFIKPVLT